MKKLPVGIESFKELIDWDYYYVDKTLFIKELLDDRNKVSLFTRPRRFGKTLAMSMLQTFFEDERDLKGKKKDNRAYFERTEIIGAGEAYLHHMGQLSGYIPVLKIGKTAGISDGMRLYGRRNPE